MTRTSAVVVAGGRGDRFGALKQFSSVAGARLVDHAVAAAAAVCNEVVLVLPAGTAWEGAPVHAAVSVGATRAESVRAGLAAMSDDVDIVVVHDAARPLATPELFELVLNLATAAKLKIAIPESILVQAKRTIS